MGGKQQYSLRDFFAEAERHLPARPGATISFKSGGRVVTAIRCADGTIELSGLAIRERTPPIGAQIRTVG